MAKRNAQGSISGTSTAQEHDAEKIMAALKAAYGAINPEQMYLAKGMWRQMVYENGTRIDLHPNKGCVVVMVLNSEQAAGLPPGVTDVW